MYSKMKPMGPNFPTMANFKHTTTYPNAKQNAIAMNYKHMCTRLTDLVHRNETNRTQNAYGTKVQQ